MPPLVHCTVIACVVIGQSIAVALVFQTVSNALLTEPKAKCSKELASMIGLTENVVEKFLFITFFSASKPNLESACLQH